MQVPDALLLFPSSLPTLSLYLEASIRSTSTRNLSVIRSSCLRLMQLAVCQHLASANEQLSLLVEDEIHNEIRTTLSEHTTACCCIAPGSLPGSVTTRPWLDSIVPGAIRPLFLLEDGLVRSRRRCHAGIRPV